MIAEEVLNYYIVTMVKRNYGYLNFKAFYKDLKLYLKTVDIPSFDLTSRKKIELKILLPLLDDILDHPEEPSVQINKFLDAFWGNRDDKYAKHNDIWTDMLHYANEIENYEPNPEIRKYGLSDAKRAITLTKRMARMVRAVLEIS